VRVEIDPDAARLRALLRDLLALSAMPATWMGKDPPAIAAGLADALVELLQLDFVFVRLSDPGGGGAVDVTRGSASSKFSGWLEEQHGATTRFRDSELVEEIGDNSEPCRGLVIPIGFSGEEGVIAAACGRSDFPTEIDRLLLSLAGNHAATAFHNARLLEERTDAEAELRQAHNVLEAKVAERTAELAASRRRIVAASDETRRRIERDLHDGTQQRLVSLLLAVRAAEGSVPPEREDLKAELSRVATGLVEAVEDLRELSRGIHPPALSKGGLCKALARLADRSGVPVALDVTTDERLPEPIEIGAYFVASEALANAAKHAQASHIDMSLIRRDDSLLLSVRDDGIGGAVPGEGSGLVGLQDRVEALGGKIRIDSPPGEGTSLLVALPLDAALTAGLDGTS
jgi:signal transduction histidine kinase